MIQSPLLNTQTFSPGKDEEISGYTLSLALQLASQTATPRKVMWELNQTCLLHHVTMRPWGKVKRDCFSRTNEYVSCPLKGYLVNTADS